jgi:hypothetical protein
MGPAKSSTILNSIPDCSLQEFSSELYIQHERQEASTDWNTFDICTFVCIQLQKTTGMEKF